MRQIIITLSAITLLAASTGVAAAQDYRSPDARDAARALNAWQSDLRSPDARDAARNRVVTYTPGRVPQVTPHAFVLAPAQGFDWADAGIGAAGMLGLIAVVGGTLLLTTPQRRERRRPLATS